jgi:hypothetical protein
VCCFGNTALDVCVSAHDIADMLNLLSLAIGVCAAIPILFALLPFLGWANWFILPLPVAGAVIGALSSSTSGRNLNLVLLAVAVGRLFLGGGLF